MKQPLTSLFLAAHLFAASVLLAAEAKPAPPADAAKMDLIGQYQGKWTSADGATGDLTIVLKSSDTAEATFTFEGNPIATEMKSIQVEGAKLKLVFSWKIQDTSGQSTLDGELDGKVLRGAYETSTADGRTRGTWTATRR